MSRSTAIRSLLAVAVVAGAAAVASDSEAIRSLLLGLGSGALISAIGLGIVLTYRGSGVINFATGAMAMYVAYVFADLRTDGRLLVIAWKVDLGAPLATVPAIVVSVLLAGVLGLLLHLLVFRPLRRAPVLAKAVASVGVLLVLQALIVLSYTSTTRTIPAILSQAPQHLPGGLVIPRSQVLLALIVIVVTALLWALFRFTRFGLTARAAADNERGATLLGYSVDMLSGASWVLSGVVVGLLGVLTGSVNGTLDPNTITLVVVPALGAALLGGFTSFGLTVVAGIGTGMLQSLILYLSTKSWFPQSDGSALPGLDQTLPFVIVVVALFVRGRSLPIRGALETTRLPFAPFPRHVFAKTAVLSVVTMVALFTLNSDWRLSIINTLVGVVICLSLVVLTGFVGQISLAQMALAGASGFTLAKLAGAGVPFPIAPLLGALGAMLLGLITAIPALRVRGVNLAVVTLAAAVAIENMVFKNPSWSGGFEGAHVPPPRFLGLHFAPTDHASLGDGRLPNPWFGVFCLIVVAAVALGIVNLRRSGTGRRMLAVRANERAAAAAGVDVRRTKLLAFAISAFVAGIAGALSAYRFGSVTPEYFGSLASMTFLAFAYLGGISSVTGAVVGGFFVTGGVMANILDNWFGLANDYVLLLGGLGLILTAVLNPEGIAGAVRDMADKVRQRLGARAPRMGSRAPTAAADDPVRSG